MNFNISNQSMIAFPPGYYLKEYLLSQKMRPSDLAEKMGISEETVSKLIDGQIDLNELLIVRLSAALGTSQNLWSSLNDQYLKNRSLIEQDLATSTKE